MTTPAPTPETPTAAPAAAKGNITFEDVRIALGNTDPDETHAGKLRAIIGRGSNKTVQIHLDAIRKARAPAMPGTQAPPPAPPKDAMEAVWTAAWLAAQAHTYGRAERLSAERDAALQIAVTRASEIAGLNEDVDALREKITLDEASSAAATEALAKANADAAEARASEQASAAKAATHVTSLESIIERLGAIGKHDAEIAKRDAQLAEQSMQKTIDRLTDQVGELKSLLHATRSAG